MKPWVQHWQIIKTIQLIFHTVLYFYMTGIVVCMCVFGNYTGLLADTLLTIKFWLISQNK